VGAPGTASKPEGYTFAVKVDNVYQWNPDDVAVIPEVLNQTGGDPFVVHIVSISGDTLTVIAVNGVGTYEADNPVIADGSKMVWLGNAKHELDAQTDPYHIFPQPYTNYAQRFMAQVEESLFMFDAQKEVKWNINNHRIQAMYSYRMGQELATLFGVKGYKKIGTDYYHHMGGIVNNISKTSSWSIGAGMKTSDLYKWAKAAFTGNSGSDVKYLFGGGEFIQQLNALEPVQKQMSASNTYTKYGITFNEIVTNFGVFRVMHHDLLNSVGYEKKALVLDMPYISRPIRKKLKTTKLELIKSGQRNANAYLLDETFTVGTEYTDTHMIIKDVS
jgi:hypothetical protein